MPSLTKLEKLIRNPLSTETLAAADREIMAKPDSEIGQSLMGYFYNDIDRKGNRSFRILWCDDIEYNKAESIASGHYDINEKFSPLVIVLARSILLAANKNGFVDKSQDNPLYEVLIIVENIQNRIDLKEISPQFGEHQARDVATKNSLHRWVVSDDGGSFVERLAVGLKKELDRTNRNSLHRVRRSPS